METLSTAKEKSPLGSRELGSKSRQAFDAVKSQCLCTCHSLTVGGILYLSQSRIRIHPPLYPLLFQPPSQEKNHIVEAGVCHHVSHSISFSIYLQMFMEMTCWSGTRLLVSAILLILKPHWESFWMSCDCPVLWRSCSSGPVGTTNAQVMCRATL